MEFNIPKYKVMQITTHHSKSTFMCNISLNAVTEHEYLGICLHHKLSCWPWSPHVDHVRNKANCLLGFLKRNLYNASTQIKEHVYKQLLLPSIEYCSAIYGTHTINKIEMIQHYAARFVLNKPWHRQQQNDSIIDMLTYLKWPSLEDQRKISCLVLLFIVPDYCLPAVAPLESNRAHRSLKLAHILSRIDIYKQSFLPRTIVSYME